MHSFFLQQEVTLSNISIANQVAHQECCKLEIKGCDNSYILHGSYNIQVHNVQQKYKHRGKLIESQQSAYITFDCKQI